MYVQDTTEEKKGWTTKNDPRVTKVGRILRKTSIDELPQLFNILIGDMSLVNNLLQNHPDIYHKMHF